MPIGDPDDRTSDTTALGTTITWEGSPETYEQALTVGDHPAEHFAKESIVLADDLAGVNFANSGLIQVANQVLNYSYNDLSIYEVAEFLIVLEMKAKSGDPVATELYALVSVVLWTGASLRQALGIRIIGKRPQNGELDCDLACILDGEKIFWRVRALPLRIVAPPLRGCTRKAVPYFELPDAVGGGRALISCLKSTISNGSIDQYTRSFPKDESWYKETLKDFAAKSNPRITWARLSRILFQHVVDRTAGNISCAALLTNTDHKLASVRRHYFSPFVRILQRVYVDCCQSLTAVLYRAGYELEELPFEITSSDDSVGSPICATMAAFQGTVQTLKARIGPPAERGWTVDKHNAYTSYVLQMLSASVCMRGTGNMYQPLQLIDLLTAYTVILDKDSGSGYKGRFVRIPPATFVQLALYEAYLARLAVHFRL